MSKKLQEFFFLFLFVNMATAALKRSSLMTCMKRLQGKHETVKLFAVGFPSNQLTAAVDQSLSWILKLSIEYTLWGLLVGWRALELPSPHTFPIRSFVRSFLQLSKTNDLTFTPASSCEWKEKSQGFNYEQPGWLSVRGTVSKRALLPPYLNNFLCPLSLYDGWLFLCGHIEQVYISDVVGYPIQLVLF